jgi:folate-binding protein YgfZ
MSAQEQVCAVRAAAGLFRLEQRGLIEVTGGDRVRWLNGMLTNDIAALAAGPERSGCYALLLTRQGRIVGDFHVLHRGDALWLETEAEAVAASIEALERFIIADDVKLRDRSGELARLGLEGPQAEAVLARALGRAPALAPDACADVALGDTPLTLAAYGWSGEPGFQLFAPRGAAPAVERALLAAGAGCGLIAAAAETLEILRIEAGVPRLGHELDPSVLPGEARLEHAISRSKGCYTGQEVIARMESRGRASHLLVGLVSDSPAPPAVGAGVFADAREVGQVTSSCRSPAAGAIALAFVRRPHDAPGTALRAGAEPVRVAALPFVAPPLAAGERTP